MYYAAHTKEKHEVLEVSSDEDTVVRPKKSKSTDIGEAADAITKGQEQHDSQMEQLYAKLDKRLESIDNNYTKLVKRLDSIENKKLKKCTLKRCQCACHDSD